MIGIDNYYEKPLIEKSALRGATIYKKG
jgi:hypothetical protein